MEVHGLILPLMASLMMILGVQPYHKLDWMVQSLRIRITINVDENDEIFEVDNITVTGKRYADVLCLGTFNYTRWFTFSNVEWCGNPSITYSWTPTTGLSSLYCKSQMQILLHLPSISWCTYNDGGTICRSSSYYI